MNHNKCKENKTMLSIIVPIYNSEKYIEECIESVRNQTYKDWELLLVDDGSNDRSVEICEKFCHKDSRIKLLLQNHAGASAARKKGIEYSAGEYVTFIDSDDWVDVMAYEKMMAAMLADKNIDISVCSYSKHHETTKIDMCQADKAICRLRDSKKALEIMFEEREFTWSLWGKIYNKKLFYCDDFIHEWWPPTYGDDTYVNWHVFKLANIVMFIPLSLYHYRINVESIMHQKVDESRLIYFEIYDNILEEFDDLNSILAKNIIMAMVKIGLNTLHELVLCGIRDNGWYKAYNILSKYENFYIEELNKQQQATYKLMGMSDHELIQFRNECLLEMRSFFDRHNTVFIYGAGKFAQEVAEIMIKERLLFAGFIVTDTKQNAFKVNGYDVYGYNEIKDKYQNMSIGIVTGLGRNNLVQVKPLLEKMSNWEFIDGTKLSLRTI